MEEITIEDKKYISSKRAAKITGYAKDYVGQLCREGRVPARLVGRNWYVLETAIQDHRFGDSDIEPKEAAKIEPPIAVLPSTWEAPRYEAASEEILPSINRLQIGHEQSKQNIQDSWRAWFDRFDHVVEDSVEPEPEEEIKETAAVDIPIHTVSRIVPPELLPWHLEIASSNWEQERKPIRHEKRTGKKPIIKTVQVCGILLATLIAITAVIGSGYFDEYILSNSQARIIAGVALYNK
jgi:hypothetical protein